MEANKVKLCEYVCLSVFREVCRQGSCGCVLGNGGGGDKGIIYQAKLNIKLGRQFPLILMNSVQKKVIQ